MKKLSPTDDGVSLIRADLVTSHPVRLSRNLRGSVATAGSDLITDSLILVWLLFCNVSPGIALIPGRINRRADQPSLTVSEDKYRAAVIPSGGEKLNGEGSFTLLIVSKHK